MKQSPNSTLSAADLKNIVEQVLKTLKQQADRTQNLQSKAIINYNPQVLAVTNPSIIGTYPFMTSFIAAPALSFGQVVSPYSSVSDFFIVQPYVASWTSNSGGINGFQLGVYALTDVPATLANHTIMYNVRGKASAYKDVRQTPNWNQAYDNNSATHLVAGAGTMETS